MYGDVSYSQARPCGSRQGRDRSCQLGENGEETVVLRIFWLKRP